MHQSGQLRAHSMQTVQLSSRKAMTPRARFVGASFSCGYCTVLAPLVIVVINVLKVTPSPFIRPGTFGFIAISSTPSEDHLQDRCDHDVGEGERDQHLPREALQLILAEPWVAEADPHDDEDEQHH